jgi:hypothetical protein
MMLQKDLQSCIYVLLISLLRQLDAEYNFQPL